MKRFRRNEVGRRSPMDERGDVAGWVLVAVMSAGLVTTLWLVADDKLGALLQQALESVAN